MSANDSKTVSTKKKQPMWLVYVALLLGGAILLADAYNVTQLDRWTARLGLSLVYTALALFVGNGRTVGFVAVAIVWLAVIASYIL
ncbi:MAG: hypothetical protein AB1483_10200 [Candidatus Zixiibacteriota bacterium]